MDIHVFTRGYVTVLSLPVARKPRLLKLSQTIRQVKAAVKLPTSLRNASKMPLTVIGIGCITAGIFTVSLIAGLVVLGGALIALEYLIADE